MVLKCVQQGEILSHSCKGKIQHDAKSSNTIEIGKTHRCKTIQRAHEFVPKVNLSNHDFAEVFGFVINKPNNVMRVENLNGTDRIRMINILAPAWNVANECCVCEDARSLSGYKLVLVEPIVIRFNKSDPISNFRFISNRRTKRLKHDDSCLTFDLNYSSYIKT